MEVLDYAHRKLMFDPSRDFFKGKKDCVIILTTNQAYMLSASGAICEPERNIKIEVID